MLTDMDPFEFYVCSSIITHDNSPKLLEIEKRILILSVFGIRIDCAEMESQKIDLCGLGKIGKIFVGGGCANYILC